MIVHSFELSFVVESEVISAVVYFGGIEYLFTNDDAITSFASHIFESVIVKRMVNLFTPAVIDGQFVVSVSVWVIVIHGGVEVSDGEYIIHTVTIGSDDIRENEICFQGNCVGDTTVAAFRSEHEQCYVIVAPAGIVVLESIAGRVDAAIAKVPIEAHVVTKVQGVALYLEEDRAISFRPQGYFGQCVEFCQWLVVDGQVVDLGNGVCTALIGKNHQSDSIMAFIFEA